MNNPERELCRPEFTLLVAGARGGKTSFLRLLLDTSDIAASNSKDDLAQLVKFVHSSSGHTPFFRTASVDIDTDAGHPLGLTLIDAPSLDFRDDPAAERTIAETLRLIDARFLDGLDDNRRPYDRHVHLCIYFLDPDSILPPPIAPLVPRTRAGSFSQPEHEPVILEPPVSSNPLMFRPALPPQDIQTIRRLSARVNVLPVIARADLLSNERLAAVKLAVRRDLADAGIGFGIFDMDNHPPLSPDDSKQQPDQPPSGPTNGYPPAHINGGGSNSTASATTSPPTSPVSPSIMRLPYALVSPDIYSHSEGVPRVPPPRHELLNQYTPSQPRAKITRRGKFLRYYRWGNLDVLDPAHCDFVPLRNAIFHHMETLQKYTREYLFEKFRSDYIQLQQQRPPSRSHLHPPTHPPPQPHSHSHPHAHSPHALSHLTHPIGHMSGLGPHPARPILAIDTQPPSQHPPLQGLHHPQPLPSMGRHPQPVPIPTSSRDILSGVSDGRTPASTTSARAAGGLGSSGIAASGDSPVASASASGRTGAGSSRPGQLSTTNKQRSKKITVACNFCRSRKLKCDGGRPACGQCLKRSNPCDYAPQNKRRNTIRQPRRSDLPGSSSSTSTRPGGAGVGGPGGGGEGDDDDISTGGDYQRGESGDGDGRSEVSMSPEVHTIPLSSTSATPGNGPPPHPGSSVSAPISRRSSNVDKREREAGYTVSSHHSLPPIIGRGERDELVTLAGPSSRGSGGPLPPHLSPHSSQQQLQQQSQVGPPPPPPPPHLQHHLSDLPRHLRDRDPHPPTHSHSSSIGGGHGPGSVGGSNGPTGPGGSGVAGGTSSSSASGGGGGGAGRFFPENDLPHIATLSLPDRSSPSTPVPMSAPSLPPIRPASEQQAALRKRAATVPGKSGGGRGSGSGPKVVACNSCRARKTKCDGAHPACASCARRQVPCLYVHDMNGNSGGGAGTATAAAGRDSATTSPSSSTVKKRRASASMHQQPPPPPSSAQQRAPHSSSSSSLTPTRGGDGRGGGYNIKDDDVLSSRSLSPPSSRLLVTPSTAGASDSRHHLPAVVGHHRSYSSFHSNPGRGGGGGIGGSDDGIIDDRDDLSRDPRDGAPGGGGTLGLRDLIGATTTPKGVGRERERELAESTTVVVDLKRPLPIEHHLDRDVDMRSLLEESPSTGEKHHGLHHHHHHPHTLHPHGHGETRAVKKMRIDTQGGSASSGGGGGSSNGNGAASVLT